MGHRTILHVDMDAFFAAVEQHDHPELRGRPVVVGAPADQRGVVAAASYEARRYGIHSAMPSREAGRRCPHAVFLPPRMARYAQVSRRIFALCERFTPLVEPLSLDEAFLDVTGARRLYGTGPEIAAQLRAVIRRETGLTASVGVAPNKFLAKLASDLHKPDGLTVVPTAPAAVRDFLAPLPVDKLWGVGRVTREKLERAGLRTIGDVQQADGRRLAALLGRPVAAALQRLSRGEDDRALELDGEDLTISREHTFLEDCREAETLACVLSDLTDDVGRRLRAAGKYAGLIRLKLRWKNYQTITRQQPLDPPACDDVRLRAAAHRLLAAEQLGAPVRLIGCGVGKLTRRPAGQLALFDANAGAPQRVEALSHAVDRIRRQFGTAAIRRADATPPAGCRKRPSAPHPRPPAG